MKLKKSLLFLLLALSVFFTACVKEKETKDLAEGVSLERKGEVVKVISQEEVDGIEILLSKNVEAENINIIGDFGFVKETENGLMLVVGSKLEKGKEICLINGINESIDVKVTNKAKLEDIERSYKRIAVQEEVLLGDFNNDKTIDLIDYNKFKVNYGLSDLTYDIAPATKGTGDWADIYCYSSADGKVGIEDLIVFVRNYGKNYPGKEVTGVEISGAATREINVGDTISLDATVSYSDGTTDNVVTWSVDQEGIINYAVANYTISATGVVGDKTVVLTAKAESFQDTVTINVKEEVKEEIGIYFHKDFANGIYAWVDEVKIFGTWPGKTDLDVYSDNPEYYEVIIDDYTAIEYLLLKDGDNKATPEDQSAKTGYVTWDENGNVKAGKPVVDNEIKITVSPSKTKYSGTDEITVTITGGTVTSRTATIGGDALTFIGEVASFKVENYIDDDSTETLSVTGVNTEVGSKTSTFDIYRKDGSIVVGNNDIDNLRIYQVMVCSFMDGDPFIGYDWQWAGYRANGDLQGVIDSLDYIKSMNFNAVWMTPIFTTYSGQQAHNGYFANDYFNIDPNFGTNDKFRELVEAAHSKGIYVILDGVMGHNAGGNIAASPLSGSTPSTSNPVNYQDGGSSLQFYKDVVYHWIRDYKIDGWRFDQSYQLGPGDDGDHKGQGGSNFYWDDIREEIERAVAANKADGDEWGILGYTVGEDWEGESGITQNTYGNGVQGLHSAFDFPTRYRVVQTLAREEYGKEATDASNLNYSHSAYPDWAHPNLMIGNHDLARFGDLINFSSNHKNNYWKRHKAAIAFMGAYSGPITLYYGEEWGSATGNSDLKSMHVSRSDGKISGFSSDEEDLRQYVTKIMEIRSEHSALWQEDTRQNLRATGNQYIDLKYDPATGEKIVFCLNINEGSETFNVTEGSSYTDLITGESFSSTSIPMDGLQARYLLVK